MTPGTDGTGNDEWTSVMPDGTIVGPGFGVDRGPVGAGPASLSYLGDEGVATMCGEGLSLFVARNGPVTRGYAGLSAGWEVPGAVDIVTITLCMSQLLFTFTTLAIAFLHAC